MMVTYKEGREGEEEVTGMIIKVREDNEYTDGGETDGWM